MYITHVDTAIMTNFRRTVQLQNSALILLHTQKLADMEQAWQYHLKPLEVQRGAT